MRADLLQKIEELKDKGELTTDAQISLILQLTYELFIGQQEIAKSLDDRGAAISELKARFDTHEGKTSVNASEHEQMKERLDKIEETLKENKDEIEIVRQSSVILWMNKHPKLSTTIGVTVTLLISFHDKITPYILSIFGFKMP